MHKTSSILAALILTLSFLASANATVTFIPNGSAIVPGLQSNYIDLNRYVSEIMIISNISDNDVQCRVTVYDHDGNDVSTRCNVYTGGALPGTGAVTVSTGINIFDIPAHSTRAYSFKEDSAPGMFGYAVIEWMGTDTQQRKALIGSMTTHGKRYSGGVYANKILINNGQPF